MQADNHVDYEDIMHGVRLCRPVSRDYSLNQFVQVIFLEAGVLPQV